MRIAILLLSLPLLAACAGNALAPAGDAVNAARAPAPMVVAHRGASAALPEHTLAAYARAIADGADAIEPDLVSTRDGVLVSRHENEIGGTTDVARRPEFAGRKTRRRIDGRWVEGWFTEDFTLAELKTLRARERLPDLRPTAHDGLYEIPTLDEIIALAAEASAREGRSIALVPELKHSSHFAAIGLPMESTLLERLAAHPHTRSAPVIVQSFETENLRQLRQRIPRESNIRLLQLLGGPDDSPHDTVLAGRPLRYAQMMTPDGLRAIAAYADAIGPHWELLQVRRTADGRHRSPLVDDAHAAGLQVIAYTYRPENRFLPRSHRDGAADARNDAGSIRQMREHIEAGIDGLFSDDSALARRAVDGDPPPQR